MISFQGSFEFYSTAKLYACLRKCACTLAITLTAARVILKSR